METVIIKSADDLKEILRIVAADNQNLSFVKTKDRALLLRIISTGTLYRLMKEERLSEKEIQERTFLSKQDLIKILTKIKPNIK